MDNDVVVQIAGNTGGPVEDGTAKGKPVVRFSVAVTKAYRTKLTSWVKVTVMNEGLLAPLKAAIGTGTPVACEGYMSQGSFNGKPQFSMIAYRVWVMTPIKSDGTGRTASNNQTATPVQGW